jgi:hypothetical protein
LLTLKSSLKSRLDWKILPSNVSTVLVKILLRAYRTKRPTLNVEFRSVK